MPTMLPAAPKTLGRLSDVFISALGAISGKNNRLGFPSASKACVVLIDGLGSSNLRAAGGHAPFLNAALAGSKGISTVFPSTTAAAITSFGTGLMPGLHGVLGYSVFDRENAVARNMLSGWSAEFGPESFSQTESVASLAKQSNVDCFAVGPGEYANSGFTNLSMSEIQYVSVSSHEESLQAVRKILVGKGKALIYLYFPELDQAAHTYGVASQIWLNRLEAVDGLIKRLAQELPADTGMLVTADHGIVDVPSDKQIMLDKIDLPGLQCVTGDPRNTFLYFSSPAFAESARTLLREKLAGQVIVATAAEVIEQGWYGNHSRSHERFMPDLFLISEANYACYHRGYSKAQSLKMEGQHGGISAEELIVPLLRFGRFATHPS